MFKKFALLGLIFLSLTLTLTACGDPTTQGVPLYPKAEALSLPADLRDQFLKVIGSGSKVEAFQTADPTATVKAYFTDIYTKNNWSDATSDTIGGAAPVLKASEQFGGFLISYKKGSQTVVVAGLPNIALNFLGITGLKSGNNVYITFTEGI